jgi:hypothetical protein
MKKLFNIIELIVNILGIIIMGGLMTIMLLAIVFMLFINPQGLMIGTSMVFRIALFLILMVAWGISCICMWKENKCKRCPYQNKF